MIVQFFGLFIATQVFSGATYSQVQSVQVISSASGAILLVAYIIVLTAVMLLLLKIYKGDKFFIILEGAVIFISSFFVFYILFAIVNSSVVFTIFGNQITTNLIAGVVLALAIVVLKNKWQKLRNAVAMLASVGVGVVLGLSFGFFAAIIFMAILAVYDFIAVFVTKHMVSMARAMSGRNLAFLIGVNEVEAVPKSKLSRGDVAEYEKDRKAVEKVNPIFSKLYKESLVPIAARIELGTGDMVAPLMVAVAAYKVSLNFMLSFFIIAGSLLGLVITTSILRKYKRALPAIPPLFFGIVVAVSAYAVLFNFVKL